MTGSNGKVADNFTSIHDAPLHWSGRGHGKDGSHDGGLPPENVLQEIDAQELNRMFVRRCNPLPVLFSGVVTSKMFSTYNAVIALRPCPGP